MAQLNLLAYKINKLPDKIERVCSEFSDSICQDYIEIVWPLRK